MGSSTSKPEMPQEDTPQRHKQYADQEDEFTTPKQKRDLEKLADLMPNHVDEETKTMVNDYRLACNNGKGPAASCFAYAEYISLFEAEHVKSNELYRNACFRPAADKSSNTKMVDGTKAFPSACFNLGRNLITGKGGTVDRLEAYKTIDRACRGDHGGACYLQAQILAGEQGMLHPDIPHDVNEAMSLYEDNCRNKNDSMSCYTVATMLLRGQHVRLDASNVTPEEAQGKKPLVKRTNEEDRGRPKDDRSYKVARDPPRARDLLEIACNRGLHTSSCHNLAVMYKVGDEGVAPDPKQAAIYQKKTEENIDVFGGF
jgi:TPR repeat protein